jgi:5-oxoprolinase (ATP-hydrolysing)
MRSYDFCLSVVNGAFLSACADAYLTPCIQNYVKGFASGFKDKEKLHVLFMQSDGGLTPMNSFSGSRAILSGPAGGVVCRLAML